MQLLIVDSICCYTIMQSLGVYIASPRHTPRALKRCEGAQASTLSRLIAVDNYDFWAILLVHVDYFI